MYTDKYINSLLNETEYFYNMLVPNTNNKEKNTETNRFTSDFIKLVLAYFKVIYSSVSLKFEHIDTLLRYIVFSVDNFKCNSYAINEYMSPDIDDQNEYFFFFLGECSRALLTIIIRYSELNKEVNTLNIDFTYTFGTLLERIADTVYILRRQLNYYWLTQTYDKLYSTSPSFINYLNTIQPNINSKYDHIDITSHPVFQEHLQKEIQLLDTLYNMSLVVIHYINMNRKSKTYDVAEYSYFCKTLQTLISYFSEWYKQQENLDKDDCMQNDFNASENTILQTLHNILVTEDTFELKNYRKVSFKTSLTNYKHILYNMISEIFLSHMYDYIVLLDSDHINVIQNKEEINFSLEDSANMVARCELLLNSYTQIYDVMIIPAVDYDTKLCEIFIKILNALLIKIISINDKNEGTSIEPDQRLNKVFLKLYTILLEYFSNIPPKIFQLYSDKVYIIGIYIIDSLSKYLYLYMKSVQNGISTTNYVNRLHSLLDLVKFFLQNVLMNINEKNNTSLINLKIELSHALSHLLWMLLYMLISLKNNFLETIEEFILWYIRQTCDFSHHYQPDSNNITFDILHTILMDSWTFLGQYLQSHPSIVLPLSKSLFKNMLPNLNNLNNIVYKTLICSHHFYNIKNNRNSKIQMHYSSYIWNLFFSILISEENKNILISIGQQIVTNLSPFLQDFLQYTLLKGKFILSPVYSRNNRYINNILTDDNYLAVFNELLDILNFIRILESSLNKKVNCQIFSYKIFYFIQNMTKTVVESLNRNELCVNSINKYSFQLNYEIILVELFCCFIEIYLNKANYRKSNESHIILRALDRWICSNESIIYTSLNPYSPCILRISLKYLRMIFDENKNTQSPLCTKLLNVNIEILIGLIKLSASKKIQEILILLLLDMHIDKIPLMLNSFDNSYFHKGDSRPIFDNTQKMSLLIDNITQKTDFSSKNDLLNYLLILLNYSIKKK